MNPVHFLLVDDLEENLLSLEALLRRDGLVLLKAKSGDEALELLLHHDVALALVDVQMPGLDGFELAELMRGNERTRRIPIIFVTAGSADRERRFRGYGAGAVDFIQKPIEPDMLRSKADVFFELSLQRQQIVAQRDELEAQSKALKDAACRKDVLLREINHRIKNLFALTSGLITLSSKSAASVDLLASDLKSRLRALSDAHELTLPDLASEDIAERTETSVKALLDAILAPHGGEGAPQILLQGADAAVSGNALTSLALLLHELATNAAKYGALSTPGGALKVDLAIANKTLHVTWDENTGFPLQGKSEREGFGSALEKTVLRGLGGAMNREWRDHGLSIELTLPLERLRA